MADSFQFLSRRLDGDGVIVARVTSVQNSDAGAEAGVMIRQSLTANSPGVFIGVTPSRGINFERRTTVGGASARTAGGAGSAPLWVKLQRSGTVLSGYYSADGVSWTLVKTLDVPMSYSVHAGLAVSSHRPGILCEAGFAQVSLTSTAPGRGLRGDYFDEPTFTHLALSRGDGSVNFDWGATAPDALVPSDDFSVRWTGEIEPELSQLYTFTAASANQLRLWIGGQLVIDDWKTHSNHERSGAIALEGGRRYPLTLEYVANTGSAVARLLWSSATFPKQAVPEDRLFAPVPPQVAEKVEAAVKAPEATETVAVSSPTVETSAEDPVDSDTEKDPASLTAEVPVAVEKEPVVAGAVVEAEPVSKETPSEPENQKVEDWISRDIGAVGLAGAAGYDAASDVFTLQGAGTDIGNSADSFHFLSRRLDGDGAIVARVAGLQAGDAGAEAGVAIRQSLEANSPMVFVGVTPSRGVNFERRTMVGSNSARTAGIGSAPLWVKLERRGTLLSGYTSTEGVTWTLVKAVDVPMNYTLFAGLVASSHRTNALATATFTNVSLTPKADGHGLRGDYFDEPTFNHLALSREDGTVNFDWSLTAPDALLPEDNFSVRWTGEIEPEFSEPYTFFATSANQVRLWIGEQLVIDDWKPHSNHERSGTITLQGGIRYPISMEYVARSGTAVARLGWASPSQPKQTVPESRLYSSTSEKQQEIDLTKLPEMEIPAAGFKSGPGLDLGDAPFAPQMAPEGGDAPEPVTIAPTATVGGNGWDIKYDQYPIPTPPTTALSTYSPSKQGPSRVGSAARSAPITVEVTPGEAYLIVFKATLANTSENKNGPKGYNITFPGFKAPIEVGGKTYVFVPHPSNSAASPDSSSPFQIRNQKPKSGGQLPVTKYFGFYLLPVDIDVIHPATGEFSESKEDTGDGGYVAIRRMSDDVDLAPVTKLVIRAISGAQSSWKTRLKFSPGNRYKIYSDQARTQEVTSEQTEFSATQDTTLYFQGLKKSQSRGGEDIKMQVGLNGQWSDGDAVKCTVVQSDFQIQVRAFIPFAWTDPEEPLFDPFHPTAAIVAGGDSRSFSLSYADDTEHYADAPFRLLQEVVITPYADLRSAADIEAERKTQTAPLSKHYDKNTQVPEAQRNDNFGPGPLIGSPLNQGAAFISGNTAPHFREISRTAAVTKITLNLGGQDGAIFLGSILGAVIPDINWTIESTVDINDPLNPVVRISGYHDRYPAYEVISIKEDGAFEEVYQYFDDTELPGIYSLGGIDPIFAVGTNENN